MKPLSQLTPKEANRLRGVLFDLDDTVLDHGALSCATYQALHELAESGLRLIGVTGRPASWGQVLVRQWPVAAMLTENGAIGLVKEHRRIRVLDRLEPYERSVRTEQLRALGQQLASRFPQLQLTDDAFGRLADVSFDIAESNTVSEQVITEATQLAREHGATVIRSSVHLHITFDTDDKASGALRVLRELFGVEPTLARMQYAFIGDSGNDAPCFAAFSTTVGVRNLSGRFSVMPRYQTEAVMGQGFVEFARCLMSLRDGEQKHER